MAEVLPEDVFGGEVQEPARYVLDLRAQLAQVAGDGQQGDPGGVQLRGDGQLLRARHEELPGRVRHGHEDAELHRLLDGVVVLGAAEVLTELRAGDPARLLVRPRPGHLGDQPEDAAQAPAVSRASSSSLMLARV
ncbi:hypothetical protein MAUB1S_03691 [Mycolicibacterium aubagnense]